MTGLLIRAHGGFFDVQTEGVCVHFGTVGEGDRFSFDGQEDAEKFQGFIGGEGSFDHRFFLKDGRGGCPLRINPLA